MSSRPDKGPAARRPVKKGAQGACRGRRGDRRLSACRGLRRSLGSGPPTAPGRSPPDLCCALSPPPGIDLDDARRKREDNIVQLRKDRRDENLQKKRMVSAVAAEGGELESNRAGQVQQKVRRRRLPPPQSSARACLLGSM